MKYVSIILNLATNQMYNKAQLQKETLMTWLYLLALILNCVSAGLHIAAFLTVTVLFRRTPDHFFGIPLNGAGRNLERKRRFRLQLLLIYSFLFTVSDQLAIVVIFTKFDNNDLIGLFFALISLGLFFTACFFPTVGYIQRLSREYTQRGGEVFRVRR